MATNVADELARIQGRYSFEFDRARDETRTPEWQKKQLAKAYRKLKADVDAMLEREERNATRSARNAHERIFGPGVFKGDPATVIVSMRDAADRAERTENPAQAMDLLKRAERIGDETLARAVVRVALDRDWTDVGNVFLETREELAEPLNELWQTHGQQATRADQFQLNMVISNMKPRELHGLMEHQIEALVADEAEPAQAGAGTWFSAGVPS